MNSQNKILKTLWDFTRYGDYSTSETWTGNYWTDGKKIYKKTISCGTLPSTATTKSVAHNISNIKDLIKIEGVASASNGDRVPIPFIQSNQTQFYIGVYMNNTNIQISTGGDRSAFTTSYVTVYYTCTDR